MPLLRNHDLIIKFKKIKIHNPPYEQVRVLSTAPS